MTDAATAGVDTSGMDARSWHGVPTPDTARAANPDRKPVLVLGASGNVGSALTRRLATTGREVRAFYDPSTPQTVTFPAEVTAIPGTFDDTAALDAAMNGVDAVFMLTPPSEEQVRWQRAIATSARQHRVRRIVKLSAFDTGRDSILQMGRWHHDGEVAVAESGCQYVVLRPQYFMQMLLGALTTAAQTGIFTGPATASTRMGIVDVNDIAAVAAVALTAAGRHAQVLVPTGPAALSFQDMAAELAVLVGRETAYVQRPVDDVRRDFAGRGWPEWHITDYLAIHDQAASPLVTDCVQEVTGTAPTSFAAFLRRSEHLLLPA